METKKLKKLTLKKETIENLSQRNMNELKGGSPFSIGQCSQSLCFQTRCKVPVLIIVPMTPVPLYLCLTVVN